MNYARIGFFILAFVIFGIVVGVTAIDIILTARRKHPVGYYINEFVIVYPWFGTLLAFVVGAMVAHFFLNILDH